MDQGVRYAYEEAMVDLAEVMVTARQLRNPSALVAAIGLRAKISGLFVAERQNKLSPFAEMDAEQVADALDALSALRLAKAGSTP